MDREAAVKLWREIGSGLPGDGATERLIEAFATAVEAAARERIVSAIEALAAGWGDQAEEYGMRLAGSEARKA